MPLNFPSSPATNAIYTSGSSSWQWNGTSWVVYTAGANGPIYNSQITAKGALISGSSANTPATLAVGANGTYLIANSATTSGLQWINPGSATLPDTLMTMGA
jgi:hypothetical protein